jgi:hypothetical protein
LPRPMLAEGQHAGMIDSLTDAAARRRAAAAAARRPAA